MKECHLFLKRGVGESISFSKDDVEIAKIKITKLTRCKANVEVTICNDRHTLSNIIAGSVVNICDGVNMSIYKIQTRSDGNGVRHNATISLYADESIIISRCVR